MGLGGGLAQSNHCSTELIVFPDADGSLNSFKKGICYNIYIKYMTRFTYLIELGKPGLQHFLKNHKHSQSSKILTIQFFEEKIMNGSKHGIWLTSCGVANLMYTQSTSYERELQN